MGTEAFWIPAVLAMTSVGGEAINQSAANKRGQNVEVQAMDQQNLLKNQANSAVKQQISDIANSDPAKLANAENSQFVSTLRKNVGGTTGTASTSPTNFGAPTSALGPVPGASSKYKSGSAAANTEVQQFGNTNAGEVSALDSAINMRKNEGLAMNTLTGTLNQLNQNAYGDAFVNNLREKVATQENPWVSMFTKGLGLAAGGMSKNGWFANGGNGATPYTGTGAIGSGLPGDPTQIGAPNLYPALSGRA